MLLVGDWKVLVIGVEAAMGCSERELGFLGNGGGGERERERGWR